MPNAGSFKPLCKHGHSRAGNVSVGGHCLTCMRKWNKRRYPGIVQQRNSDPGYSARQKAANWKVYGITNDDGSPFQLNDFNRAFQIQGGRCKGCLRHQSELSRPLGADHDHATGKFRGLLCHSCNVALGLLKDSRVILQTLINYLGATQ